MQSIRDAIDALARSLNMGPLSRLCLPWPHHQLAGLGKAGMRAQRIVSPSLGATLGHHFERCRRPHHFLLFSIGPLMQERGRHLCSRGGQPVARGPGSLVRGDA